MKNVNVEVPEDLWLEAKVKALQLGILLRDFVEQALREKLDKDGGKDGK